LDRIVYASYKANNDLDLYLVYRSIYSAYKLVYNSS
jgi:hypothetical protein